MSKLRLTQAIIGALLGYCTMAASPTEAALPELRLAPLKYEAHLEPGHPKTGIIDASNPTGSAIHVNFEVQGFRQKNNQGELEFFDDERLSSAISTSLSGFDIGPREAIRVPFSIDPAKLGPGGVYGVIFLRTLPAPSAANAISPSARVGTLLILDVGSGGAKSGQLTHITAPKFIIGNASFNAGYSYANTGAGPTALAFAPSLGIKLGWYGQPKKLTGPFVFPGRTRSATVSVPAGNHIGPVPITISDLSTGGHQLTGWTFMLTGYWIWAFPLCVIMASISLFAWRSQWSRRRRRNLSNQTK